MTSSSHPCRPPPERAALSLVVVGIGASAGGLKALQQFLEAVPADSGMAYVVILHLDPERESRMRDLLQDRTVLPVVQVDGTTTVEADHVYIIPPGHDLVMERTSLELRKRGERAEHAPVDLFLRTLAEAYGPNAVGVILSGTGADGTAGIRHVREAGGVTVAQRPEESDYDGMPASAISTGLIDLVLAAGRIPAELVRLRSTPSPLGGGDWRSSELEGGLAPIFAALRSRTGHDFSQYRRSTVLRRLDRRLRFNGVTSLDDYRELLQSSRTENQALLKDLLISVSSFFRDHSAFDALAGLVPRLFEGKDENDTVRVWVVGCATGEEVYSIGMVLWDHAATLSNPPRLQLFATDIDEHGYKWARAGLYTTSAVADLSPDRLQRFFTKEPGGYRIAKFLRERVLFAGHNVLHDPPFSRMDLIACRNLFIYLHPPAQQRVLDTFHYAMNPNGLLFLGASESTGESGLFTAIGDGGHRLYRRNATPHRTAPRVTTADPLATLATPSDEAEPTPSRPVGTHERFSYGAQHVRMLEQYAATSIVVDERLDVVHMSAGADRFLHMSEGEATHNLLRLARGALRRTLRTALHHAFDAGERSTRRVALDVDGEQRNVTVQVRPSRTDATDRFALVIFEVESRDSPVRPERESTTERELDEELQRTRDLLESTSIAHDRTVAELQTVNEELQSINEEQRAATEELETGREEIQSINEELTTINQEHQSTIEELKRTNADLQNLIESTEIGTIFIDRATRIRRFTPAVTSIFNFVAADRGRPLSHITHRLKYEELEADVAQVLGSLDRIEREVVSDSGESYMVRINPYRSFNGQSEGAVLTFYDNTVQHRIRQELVVAKLAADEAKLAAEAANLAKGTFLSTLSHEFRTPLNAILGYADLLPLDGPLNEAQERKIDRIKTGGWHLARMIEEILSFAKLDSGHEHVEAEFLDARSVAHEASALCENAAREKGLEFVLEVPEERIDIRTDRGKARQILINLCGNAVKYTNAGEVRVQMRRRQDDVIFEVSDTGIGISPEHFDHIFERFWQVDGGSTRAAGGLGIGLAAAREYARLLHGDVEVESEAGRGSTFRLTLPLDYDRR